MSDEHPRAMYPVRHVPGLFSLDIASISLKDVRQQMEFPFFSLSKKPDLEPRRYEDRNGNSLEVTPSVKGLPTIYDKDFLICAVSHVMDRLNRGEPASRRLILYASDMLEFANRTKSGRDYKALDDALTRLRGCTVKTNIQAGDLYRTSIFGLIESGDLVRKYGFDGRLQYVRLTLSEWLWAAIEARQVLTLHPDYFRLRQPLERRIYEIARKHCGRQPEWTASLALLHHRSGSKSKLYEFRRAARRIAAGGDLLDYSVTFDASSDSVTFRRLEGSLVAAGNGTAEPDLPDAAAEEARRRHGPGLDLAAAERDWRGWMRRKGVRPTNPAAFFLSFLETWVDRRAVGAAAPPDDGPNWIEKAASEWWGSLDEAECDIWRDRIGRRADLGNGEGWFVSEKSFAQRAFRLRWERQSGPAHGIQLPPSLLAQAAARAGRAPEAVEAGWRKWIRKRTYMHGSPLVSVLVYAAEAAEAPEADPRLPGLD